MGRSRVSQEEIYCACKFLFAGTYIKERASSRRGELFFFVDYFLTDRANKLTRSILRKGCLARVLLFLVNWGYPIVWGYNSRENKLRNPFPSVVQLLTSPDCLVIDLDSTTNNYSNKLVTLHSSEFQNLNFTTGCCLLSDPRHLYKGFGSIWINNH